MINKKEFVDQLDGTAAKIEAAFKAGYDAGFIDGGLGQQGYFDIDDEWKWYKERETKNGKQDGI